MKIRMIVSVIIFILVVLIIAGSCATRRKAILGEDFMEAWSDTWINADYDSDIYYKIINYPDGIYECFATVTSTIHGNWGKDTLIDKWVASKGAVWYRAKWESFYFWK